MKKLIIIEGKDDQKFIESLCIELKIANLEITPINNGKFKGGKSNLFLEKDLSSTIKAKYDEFNIKEVSIICDADYKGINDGFDSTITKLKKIKRDILQNAFIKDNIRNIEYFVIPNNQDDGNLETLFLNSLPKNLELKINCVDNYLKCLNVKIDLHKIDKLKSQSLLTILGEKDDTRNAGYAAKQDNKNQYWNFESKALDPLKKFLLDFSNS